MYGEDQRLLKKLGRWIPGAQDLIRMAVREAWQDKVATAFGYDEEYPAEFGEWLTKQGGSTEWAKRYWRAHWDLPSPLMGYDMLHRGVIDRDTLETLLRVADYPRFWRDAMIAISYQPLTRVDVRRMYGLGVLDRAGVKNAYLQLGYDDTNAERMAEFTVRYEDLHGESKPEKYRELTQAQVIKAYSRGLFTRQEAVDSLKTLRYTDEDIEFFLNMADFDKAIAKVPDYSAEYQRDVKSIVENAYGRALIGKDTASSMLKSLGLAEADVAYTLAAVEYGTEQADKDSALDVIAKGYVTRAITRTDAVTLIGRLNIPATQQERLFQTWDLERDLRNRRLTEAQYRKAYTLGLINLEGYAEALRGLGYTEADIKLLVDMIETEEAGATGTTPKQKLLTVNQYMQALAEGVITKEHFILSLRQLNYTETDVTILMAFAMREKE